MEALEEDEKVVSRGGMYHRLVLYQHMCSHIVVVLSTNVCAVCLSPLCPYRPCRAAVRNGHMQQSQPRMKQSARAAARAFALRQKWLFLVSTWDVRGLCKGSKRARNLPCLSAACRSQCGRICRALSTCCTRSTTAHGDVATAHWAKQCGREYNGQTRRSLKKNTVARHSVVSSMKQGSADPDSTCYGDDGMGTVVTAIL
jgi:hypothetical protein